MMYLVYKFVLLPGLPSTGDKMLNSLIPTIELACIRFNLNRPRFIDEVVVFGRVEKYCFNLSSDAGQLALSCCLRQAWREGLPSVEPPLEWLPLYPDGVKKIGLIARGSTVEAATLISLIAEMIKTAERLKSSLEIEV